jgi:hypothetical protein
MRKRLSLAAGLIAVMLAIVGPPFVVLSVRPFEPALRVGMTHREAIDVLEQQGRCAIIFEVRLTRVFMKPDCLGGQCEAVLRFNWNQDCLTRWEIIHLPRTRPPWLDTAMKGSTIGVVL